MFTILLIVCFLIYPSHALHAVHARDLTNQIPFDEIKFPFPYRELDPLRTRMVSQGAYAVIEKGDGFDRLFTEPLSPCVAIVIWDSLGNKALFAHLDHFRSISDLIRISRQTFHKDDNLHAFLYSVDNGFNTREDLLMLYNLSSQKEILSKFKRIIKDELTLQPDQISAKLLSPGRPIFEFGEYSSAMVSLGFDLGTMSFFTSSFEVEIKKYWADQSKKQKVRSAWLKAYLDVWNALPGFAFIDWNYTPDNVDNPQNFGTFPFQKAFNNEELLKILPKKNPAQNVILSYLDYRASKKPTFRSFTKPSLIKPQKPSPTKIKYPFPFHEFDRASTQLVGQGEFFFIKRSMKKSRLFTFPCAPCPGIVIYDNELKQAWMGHVDYLVDLHSIYTAYKLYFPLSKLENIKVVIFAAKNPDLDEEKFREFYKVENLPMLIKNIKDYIEQNLKIPRTQISAKIWNIVESATTFGINAIAQRGLGYDIKTGECFTTECDSEIIPRFHEHRRQSIWKMYGLKEHALCEPARFGSFPLVQAEAPDGA